MINVDNLVVRLSETKKVILNGINFSIKPGEIHILNGNNGSGKSTFVSTLMGDPSLEVSTGSITLEGDYPNYVIEKIDKDFVLQKKSNFIKVNLIELDPDIRSLLGLYLAFQYPIEIPGVPISSYLRLIYNSRKEKKDQLPLFKFKELMMEKAKQINYPQELLKRNLNEGFSGGEKKKTEILQMLILEPKYIMLDEIDSGLDKKSVIEVFTALKNLKEKLPKTSFIIITHYDKFIDFIKPDYIHIMEKGIIKESVKC